MNISRVDRIEKLEQQASITHLLWQPKKDEVLIGNYEGYTGYQNGLSLLFLRDKNNVIYRVSMGRELTIQLLDLAGKHISPDDLISIHYLGSEKSYHDIKNDVFKLVIDRGASSNGN